MSANTSLNAASLIPTGCRGGQLPLRELKGGHGIPPESGGRDTRRRNRRHRLRGHRPLRGKPEILPRTPRPTTLPNTQGEFNETRGTEHVPAIL